MGTRKSGWNHVALAPFVAAILIALQIISGAGCSQNAGDHTNAVSELNWMTDYGKALAEARATGKPVMVDFFATWCGPCKLLDSKTYSDKQVIEQSRSMIVVRIDVDKNEELAKKFNIESIPTIVFLSPNGNEITREIGFTPASSMLSLMKRAQVAKL